MGEIYKQLSIEERTMIQTQLEMGIKPAAIAVGSNHSASTLSPELRRKDLRARRRCPGIPSRCYRAGGRTDPPTRRLRKVRFGGPTLAAVDRHATVPTIMATSSSGGKGGASFTRHRTARRG